MIKFPHSRQGLRKAFVAIAVVAALGGWALRAFATGEIQPQTGVAVAQCVGTGIPKSTQTNVGTAVASVPATALTGRRFVEVRLSEEQTTGALCKCRVDGTDPAMGATTAGDVFAVGSSKVYFVYSDKNVRCICDTAGVYLSAFECK